MKKPEIKKWFANRPVRIKLMLVILAGVGVFVLLNSFTTYKLGKTRKSSELVERSHGAVEAADEALGSLTAMESNYRAFLISGDSKFLDAYNQQKSVYTQKLAAVKKSSPRANPIRQSAGPIWRIGPKPGSPTLPARES